MLADDSCTQPCFFLLLFFFFFFFFYTVPFYKLLLLYRISPGEEQQGCFHSNTEASDWQPMVSVVLLPNPQIELPLHYSKYWSFSVPSGGESVDPLELTQHYWYVVFWAAILSTRHSSYQHSRAFPPSRVERKSSGYFKPCIYWWSKETFEFSVFLATTVIWTQYSQEDITGLHNTKSASNP